MLRRSLLLAAFGLLFVSCPFVQADEHAPKHHVIVMISDGGGFNTFAATTLQQARTKIGNKHPDKDTPLNETARRS